VGRRRKKNPGMELVFAMLAFVWALAKLLLLGVVGVSLFLVKAISSHPKKKPEPKKNKEQKAIEANQSWINERWALATEEEKGKKSGRFPSWYFDKPTAFQIDKLLELDIHSSDSWTKGQASDVIGLFSVADLDDEEVLRFFGVNLKGMNQSKARHVVGVIFSSDENKERWESRPPSNMQKAFCKLFELKKPRGINSKDLEAIISQHYDELDVDNQCRWDCFESTYTDLNNPDEWPEPDEFTPKFRRTSFTRYFKAVETLRNEGTDLDVLDVDLLIEHLYEKLA
tara:strand:- start:1985 stop:2836 length:852 start_codon:yes stop_codon:yes gene_type:complete